MTIPLTNYKTSTGRVTEDNGAKIGNAETGMKDTIGTMPPYCSPQKVYFMFLTLSSDYDVRLYVFEKSVR